MRWKVEIEAQMDEERTVRRFLWSPLQLDDEVRWLEKTLVVQRRIHKRGIGSVWLDTGWANKTLTWKRGAGTMQIALVWLTAASGHLIRRLVKSVVFILCKAIGMDVDFVTYGFPDDIVPCRFRCAVCGKVIRSRSTMYNEDKVRCSCGVSYRLGNDGDSVWAILDARRDTGNSLEA